MLAGITFEMAGRQQIRERWVRSGPIQVARVQPASSQVSVVSPAWPPPAPMPAPTPAWVPVPQFAAPLAQPLPQAPLPPPARPLPPPARPAEPDEEPVVWSRKVERFVPQPVSEIARGGELPSAWLQAIEKSESVVPQMPLPDSTDQAADQAADQADRPVIQPSTPGLRRYRAPFEDGAISQPIESERCEGQTASLDLGEGI